MGFKKWQGLVEKKKKKKKWNTGLEKYFLSLGILSGMVNC